MSWLHDYLERKYVRRCLTDAKYRMRVNGSRLKEIVAELGLHHIFPATDPLFTDITFYPIRLNGMLLYVCWDCGYANSESRLEMGGGFCGGCSKFLFNPRVEGPPKSR